MGVLSHLLLNAGKGYVAYRGGEQAREAAELEAHREKKRAERLEAMELALLERHKLENEKLRNPPPPVADKTQWDRVEGDDGYYWQVHPVTGQSRRTDLRVAQRPEAPRAPVRGTKEYLKAIEDEEAVRARFRSPAAPRAPEPKGPANDFERKAAFMVQGARAAVQTLATYRPKFRDRVGNVPLVGNYAMRDEAQVAEQAAMTLADAYLRLTTGATVTDSESEQFARRMLPQPGDSDAALAAKQQERLRVLRAIDSAARGDYGALMGEEKPATQASSAPKNPWR